METIHELRSCGKTELSHAFLDELPGMIQTIVWEWQQSAVGPYSFKERHWLQQAHVVLGHLLEMHEEAV